MEEADRPKHKYPQSEITKRIARNIQLLRYERGITGRELAGKSGVPYSVIANLENERRARVSVDEVLAIAKVFQVSLDWFIYAEDATRCQQCKDEPPAGYRCMVCMVKGE